MQHGSGFHEEPACGLGLPLQDRLNIGKDDLDVRDMVKSDLTPVWFSLSCSGEPGPCRARGPCRAYVLYIFPVRGVCVGTLASSANGAKGGLGIPCLRSVGFQHPHVRDTCGPNRQTLAGISTAPSDTFEAELSMLSHL